MNRIRFPRYSRHLPVFPEGLLGWVVRSVRSRLAMFCGVMAAAFLVTWWVPDSAGLGDDARRALFVLLLAAGLWLTEAIPPFAVGILIIALQVLLLGRPADGGDEWERHVLVLGHPLIWLFSGGLVMAAGMTRTGVDRWLAGRVLRNFASQPARLVVAVGAIAFVLSMVMSNTATAAMMLALITPIVADRPSDDRFAGTLVLSVPVGANLGGMASLVGTPPNAIAAGLLADHTGQVISFARWVTIGLPPALLLVASLLALLVWRVRGVREDGAMAERLMAMSAQSHKADWQVVVVSATMVLTLGLWLTQDLHGLPTPAVAVVPLVAFTATGILDVPAFRALPFDVLFLLAGGLALGQAIHETGLAAWIVSYVDLAALPVAGFVALAGAFAVVLSNIMSNTAAANVLIPFVLSVSPAAGGSAALVVALCASAAMALPVATPPNALAHGTGRVRSADFRYLGLVAGVLTPLLATGWVLLFGL